MDIDEVIELFNDTELDVEKYFTSPFLVSLVRFFHRYLL